MKGRAKLQLRRSRVQKCKGGRGVSAAWGYAGMGACCEANAEGRGVRLARPRMTGSVIPTKAGYVVTRYRPYLARRSREVVAVSGWELKNAG